MVIMTVKYYYLEMAAFYIFMILIPPKPPPIIMILGLSVSGMLGENSDVDLCIMISIIIIIVTLFAKNHSNQCRYLSTQQYFRLLVLVIFSQPVGFVV